MFEINATFLSVTFTDLQIVYTTSGNISYDNEPCKICMQSHHFNVCIINPVIVTNRIRFSIFYSYNLLMDFLKLSTWNSSPEKRTLR